MIVEKTPNAEKQANIFTEQFRVFLLRLSDKISPKLFNVRVNDKRI